MRFVQLYAYTEAGDKVTGMNAQQLAQRGAAIGGLVFCEQEQYEGGRWITVLSVVGRV